jgi:small subunit ribosomal protein S8
MLSDPLADFLTSIRNAQRAGHDVVTCPGSKLKLAVAEILKEYGYVAQVAWSDQGYQGEVAVTLRYDSDGNGMIRDLRRVSKPSRRVYVGVNEIPKVLNGLGLSVISTSQGVVSDRKARTLNMGGELLCTVF